MNSSILIRCWKRVRNRRPNCIKYSKLQILWKGSKLCYKDHYVANNMQRINKMVVILDIFIDKVKETYVVSQTKVKLVLTLRMLGELGHYPYLFRAAAHTWTEHLANDQVRHDFKVCLTTLEHNKYAIFWHNK